eukprot:7226162-Prymnesium_polylepis.2
MLACSSVLRACSSSVAQYKAPSAASESANRHELAATGSNVAIAVATPHRCKDWSASGDIGWAMRGAAPRLYAATFAAAANIDIVRTIDIVLLDVTT